LTNRTGSSSESLAAIWRLILRARMVWLAVDKVVLLVVVMKALILFDMGEAAYRAQLSAYTTPTSAQRIGLMVMTLDPVTLKLRDVASQLRRIERHSRLFAHG